MNSNKLVNFQTEYLTAGAQFEKLFEIFELDNNRVESSSNGSQVPQLILHPYIYLYKLI